MLIDYIDSSTVKITLTAHEILKIFGNYENINYKNKESKQKINKIISTAFNKTQFFEPKYIEVVPNILGGCSMYCTAIPKQNNQWMCAYEFSCINSMIDAARCLIKNSQTKFNIYTKPNKQIIVTKSELPQIAEYSITMRPITRLQEAYIKEHFKTLL